MQADIIVYNICMIYLLLGCDALIAIVFGLKFNTFPPQIPLYYTRAWGEDQLADSWLIILIPILMNVLFIVNNFVYKKYFNGNELVKKVVEYMNIFICISFTFIMIRILLLIA